jgi:hypothetical protein
MRGHVKRRAGGSDFGADALEAIGGLGDVLDHSLRDVPDSWELIDSHCSDLNERELSDIREHLQEREAW